MSEKVTLRSFLAETMGEVAATATDWVRGVLRKDAADPTSVRDDHLDVLRRADLSPEIRSAIAHVVARVAYNSASAALSLLEGDSRYKLHAGDGRRLSDTETEGQSAIMLDIWLRKYGGAEGIATGDKA